jgi:hypothetical protein
MNGGSDNSRLGPAPALAPDFCGQEVPPAPAPQRLFQSSDWRAFWVTTSVALVSYLVTLAPEVTLQFSGIFATGARYGGVPHPPGFPLWTWYAWLFTKLLPFSNIAWRAAVSSAAAGALTCGVIALIVSRGGALLLDSLNQIKRLPIQEERRLRLVCGFVAGLGFGLERAFWAHAVIVETTTLAVLLFSLVICLLLRWVYVPEQRRFLYLAVLSYGLALSVNCSLAAAAPFLPFILLFRQPALGRDIFFAIALIVGGAMLPQLFGVPVLGGLHGDPFWPVGALVGTVAGVVCVVTAVAIRGLLTEWRCVCLFAIVLGLGLSLYLYVPLASMTNPPMNWGYPRTLEGFWHTMTRGQYEAPRPTQTVGRLMIVACEYLGQTAEDLGVIYFAPALVPLFFLRKMGAPGRNWLLGLLAVFACMCLINAAVLNPTDRGMMRFASQYFPASLLGLLLWAGYGLCLLGNFLGCLGRTTNRIASSA